VELKDVRKTYRKGPIEVPALRAINLRIAPGEFLAIAGASGSGKTTLLNIIGGLERADDGEVLVDGRDLQLLSSGELARVRLQRLGFIFQAYNLLPVLTALENVELPLLLTNLSGAERKKRAQTALRVVGLEERMKHYPRQLSGGQEQRVAIARAIVNDPTIIVADEPTGDLDRKAADDILNLLEKLNKEFKKTILMVTHDPHAAERASITRKLDKGQLQ
jgi:putative ABC transport system ATP-binding protein